MSYGPYIEEIVSNLLSWREILLECAPHLLDSICSYRAGYMAQDRRSIEVDFFGGKLRGLAATNALELGIDVGHIDATLHLGFPGSIASLWQQAGRSGRRLKPSLAVYIAFEGPLDQYFMKFPQKLFRRAVESCQVDAHNQQVLEQHVACAAAEYPLNVSHDEKFFGSGLDDAIIVLRNKGLLGSDSQCTSSHKMWRYIGHERKPSLGVSIRSIETEKYKVVDKLKNEVLEEVEESKAFFQVYEGAVYLHQGTTYLVHKLDLSEKVASCQKADLKYYTKTRDYTDILVTGGDLAVWIRVPQSIKTAVEKQRLSFRAGLHASSHAFLNVVPLYIMCNSSDLSAECANPHETRSIPERILLYDQHPGGLGLSVQVQLLFMELLVAALELVKTCNCSAKAGCPNCIQALSCGEYNEVLDKKAAVLILEGVIQAENSLKKSVETLIDKAL
ncbi:hypothetical protein QJS10_CPB15g01624 [Acorus calamus]|uniref:Helicase C-terminal domain-containing protein n=1 Tax=Acorus calamus TaxID=4465 RepID=A0AAV9D5Z3_ACOCL|nr:hypothetical protein QJS10_CPB15g01624 [Acorus calamus]